MEGAYIYKHWSFIEKNCLNTRNSLSYNLIAEFEKKYVSLPTLSYSVQSVHSAI